MVADDPVPGLSGNQTTMYLIHKGLETHGCVYSAVATVTLVLKHQAISIHSADKTFLVFGSVSYQNITIIVNNMRN